MNGAECHSERSDESALPLATDLRSSVTGFTFIIHHSSLSMCRVSCAKPELLTLASTPLQADLLGTTAGIIGDAQGRSPRACRFGSKRDVEGATRPRREDRATVVCLSKISAVGPGNRKTRYVQFPGARVRERYFLLRAGGA